MGKSPKRGIDAPIGLVRCSIGRCYAHAGAADVQRSTMAGYRRGSSGIGAIPYRGDRGMGWGSAVDYRPEQARDGAV